MSTWTSDGMRCRSHWYLDTSTCNSCWGLAHIYLDTSTDNFCSLCLMLKDQGIHLLPAGALQPDPAQHWLHKFF